MSYTSLAGGKGLKGQKIKATFLEQERTKRKKEVLVKRQR